MKITPEDSRARLLAFIAMARATLPVNPKAVFATLSKMAGCDARIGTFLIELGVVEENASEGTRKWVSTMTDSEIADIVIQHRRKIDGDLRDRAAGYPASAEVVELRTELTALRKALESLANETSKQLSAIPATAKLSAEDTELLNLVLGENKALVARVEELEKIVGNLLRIEAGRASKSQAPASPEPRKWKFAVLGVWPRDASHVNDYLKLELNGQAKFVDVEYISPEDRRQVPSGIDALVYTDQAATRVRETLKNYARPMVRVHGSGNKAVAEALASIVRAAK